MGALYAAIDGGAALWRADGVWRTAAAARLYRWRGTLRAAAAALGVALASLLVPLAALVGAAVVYPAAFLLQVIGFDAGARAAEGYRGLLDLVFQPAGLPLLLPRFVVAILAVVLGVLVVGETWPRLRRRRRRSRGWVWWRLLGSPIGVSTAAVHFTRGLWQILRGAARTANPSRADLAERYKALLAENLGQPGFREVLVAVHDLDTCRDLVLALLAPDYRAGFFAPPDAGDDPRHLETVDLGGDAGCGAGDALAAALCVPILTDAQLVEFSETSRWRGEQHQLCDRDGATARLLEEVARAGVEQVIVVTALPAAAGPHSVESDRRDARARASARLAAVETAAVRDALAACRGRFAQVFQIRPVHNPLGPFDFAGAYDERSDRTFHLHELVEAGRDDGFRQFVDPVVGASGEWIQNGRVDEPAGAPPEGRASPTWTPDP